MTPIFPLRHLGFWQASWPAGVAALGLLLSMTPAHAKSETQVGVYGHVAPRCWVANPVIRRSSAEMPKATLGAVCNQATPMVQSTMRALNADGSLAIRTEATETSRQFGGRAAMEITISPQP